MSIEIRVPALGESVSEATVGRWFKQAGDKIAVDEPIVELETDKVTIEVPAPAAGVLGDILVKDGETVEVGALLGSLNDTASSLEDKVAKSAAAMFAANDEVSLADTATLATIKETVETVSNAIAPAANGAAKEVGGTAVDIIAPSAGESVTEAEVGSWFKAIGDHVDVDEPLVELETDKAAQEVPAPVSGTLTSIAAKTGEIITPGQVIGSITPGSGASAAPAAASAPAPVVSSASDMPVPPAAAKMMAENNLTSESVDGSGRRGQILKEDVVSSLETPAAAAPTPAAPETPAAPTVAPVVAAAPVTATPAAPAPVAPTPPAAQAEPATTVARETGAGEERVRMSRVRQTIARRLKEAQNTAAMLTTYNEVDMSPIMNLRKQYKELFEKKHDVKLGFMGFFTKAVCHALKEIPAVNAEIDGTDIIYKNFAHIGVAVGTDKGLVVPVVRDADQMSIAEVEKGITALGKKARDGKLGLADMEGGTFTISNGGVYGSLMSSPILNAPQSGILGMHKIQERPVAIDGQVVIRPMMYLALSYDHRIVDGKDAVTFLVRVKESLEDPQRLVLDL
jgi:2-oxoglutarate dehydrogenase E2 component (dihydrolipoamide succinyltransferase)